MLLAATVLIVLHTVDGTEIIINSSHIATLYPSHEASRGTPNTMVVKGARCVVLLGNSKFYAVVEDCATIRKSMEGP